MQRVSEAFSLDDDMVDGDLGDGMSFCGLPESPVVRAGVLHCSSQAGEMTWRLKTQQRVSWRLPRCASLNDLSKDELKDRLQEASEVIDVLCCELEVAHRYLEGKYQALKILQGKAILDKATSHTKSLLQKSDERAKALEKEVNSLQWELSFSQVQMKKAEQSWEQKYNRMVSENQSVTESLQERESEIQLLRTENSDLSRQCLELLSMFSVREQRVYTGTKPQCSAERHAGVLELAVLGACRCPGVVEACTCSRTAAASRKQLIQLQQELDAQRERREEAWMVADAFRIAFEQQLRKRSDHFLLLAENNILKSHQCKAEGVKSPLIDVRKRLRGLLPPGLELKMTDELLDSLYKLLDLLNDKEEALAHQRKVSIMLAHSAEELQRQLHLDSQCQSAGALESNAHDPPGTHSQSEQTAAASQAQRQPQLSPCVTDPPSAPSHTDNQLLCHSSH
ncbi:hypothetical protein JOB18_018321 [Solea senegalensis]|nr:coiled-coil domain-containing protein 125-like [Solea senegalensis]XP_043872624.1 coiled-coil domain-containing protein 125-like [Solea senegalensis]KAG7465478.1 hypothetical protein JOB18_018321 [Solea senegalensis]